jgi:hypothetical protein
MVEVKHVEELVSCLVTFLEGDMVHAHFKDGRTIEPFEVQEVLELLGRHGQGRKSLLVVTMGNGTSMTNEARAVASAPEANKYLAADAIVVRDFGHQLAANVFVRHHKPARPIQMFPDMDTALAWLSQQRHLIDQP